MTNQEIRKAKQQQRVHKRNWMIYFLLIIVIGLLLCIIGNQMNGAVRETDILNKLNDIDVEIAPSEECIKESAVFTITHYCPCPKCCGKYSDGITATGTIATEGRTIAVDKDVIPLGSKVYIEGLGEFIAEDTGSGVKGNHIDMFVNSHTEAINRGVIEREVRYKNQF